MPFEAFPVLAQHGWDQRDQVVTLETTAGDLEIADPIEVQQYQRWAEVLTASAETGGKTDRIINRATPSSTRS